MLVGFRFLGGVLVGYNDLGSGSVECRIAFEVFNIFFHSRIAAPDFRMFLWFSRMYFS